MPTFTTPCQYPFNPQGEWKCEEEPVTMITVVSSHLGVIYLHSCRSHLVRAAHTAQNLLVSNIN